MAFEDTMRSLREFDINDLDFENVGSWPFPVKLFIWVLILAGVLATGEIDPARITVTSRRAERIAALVEEYGVGGTTDNAEAARKADIVLLCVKPQAARGVLEDPSLAAALEGRLLVSIAAGLRLVGRVRRFRRGDCICCSARTNRWAGGWQRPPAGYTGQHLGIVGWR